MATPEDCARRYLTGGTWAAANTVGQPAARVTDATPKRPSSEGARQHNLKNPGRIPAAAPGRCDGCQRLGKSTLTKTSSTPALMRHFGEATDTPVRTTAAGATT